jgi:hypothetical protein
MQNINFEHKQNSFELTDFPDAEKIIRLRCGIAKELADVSLQISDLLQANEYLDLSIDAEDKSATQNALWKMAVITFMKCFGKNNARTYNLDIKQFFPEDVKAQEFFLYFKKLRDKNIAHDDNPIDQCLVGAIINKVDAPYKVEKIITTNLKGSVYAEDSIGNLKRMINVIQTHLVESYDELCIDLTSELESMDHTDLIKKENLIYNVPTKYDFSKDRKS